MIHEVWDELWCKGGLLGRTITLCMAALMILVVVWLVGFLTAIF